MNLTASVNTLRTSLLWRAFGSAAPIWLAVCVISAAWGLTMQILPGYMEARYLYPTSWAANLAHFDPEAYRLVAEQGYGAEGRDFQSSVRYPLFPFFVRVVTQVTGIETYFSLFWVSKVALLAGLIGLWLLVEHLHGAEQAGRALLYMAFPLTASGYTWMMSYPEALHLACWAFGFWLLFRKQYYLCGLITVLCMWTRPQAIFVLPGYAFVLLADSFRDQPPDRPRVRRILDALVDIRLWRAGFFTCGLPLIAYMGWLWYISRLTLLPFSPLTGVTMYGRDTFLLPWVRVAGLLNRTLTELPFTYNWSLTFLSYQTILVLVGLLLISLAAAGRRLSWGLVLFSLLSILPSLSTQLQSIARYALLTWIPLGVIYYMPKRFDAPLAAVGASLSFLALVAIGLVGVVSP